MQALIKKEAWKFGLIIGLLNLLLLFGTWAAGTETFVSTQFIAIWVPYNFAILLIAGFSLRKKNEDQITFQEGLKFVFMSYVIASLMQAVATYVLYNFIDPGLTDRSFQIGLEKTTRMLEKMGASEEQIEKAIADAEKNKSGTGFKTVFMGLGLGLIFDFVKSLIIAAIIKKEKKVF